MSNQSMLGKITVPYAEALLEIAQNANLLQETSKSLSSIAVVLSKSKDLQLILSNPLVNPAVKKEILQELFKNQVEEFILNFLLVLVDRRRVSFLSIIIDKYLELTYKLEAVTVAELSSAIELDEVQQNNLVNELKTITNANNVKLITNVNPDLIGGFIVKIGSKVIDASLLGKLKKISLYLYTS
uniref:ATP synthase subunit delta, chloroplastic n=1 Tax=Cliftonaea pectinata TaxID=2007206 RepID=A0A1Z1MQC9_9FLOR|nr:ATP synthase CF1 subunit delta [Cliftonaea pectinata]ARW68069.1 ATP synthase CF1 subunit delta [Cliftonaea pectinata]